MIKFIIIVIIAAVVLQLYSDYKKKNNIVTKTLKDNELRKQYDNSPLLNPPERQPNKVVEPKIEAPQYDITTFHIAGVTFKDGRESRQTSLRMLKFKDYPMNGAINFEFEQYDYEGKPAVKIYANNRVLGNVPADIVDEFIEKITNANDYDIDYQVLGGGDLTYGCEMTFIWK